MNPTLVDKVISKDEMLKPLLLFQVTLGMQNNMYSLEQLEEITKGITELKIEGFRLQFFIVPDHDSNKTEFKLLYPINNSLITEKDLLDLLTRHGYVPPVVLEDIQNEINNACNS
jgi:hypothetical protein